MTPLAAPHRPSRLPIWLLAIPSAACVLLTGLYLFDSAYRQWAEASGWISIFNAHSPLLIPILVAWGGSFFLLIFAVALWTINRREKAVPQGQLTALVLVLVLSSTSPFVPPSSYVALTVLVLGPGKNSARLQYDAVSRGSPLLLDALIVRGADIQRDLLAVASFKDNPGIVSRLIRFGLPVNEPYRPYNRTALHNAADARCYENARLLMAAGARADVRDVKGLTPVDLAANRKDEEMLRILRPRGAK